MTPSFNVPAQYFYALTANLPIEIGTDIRYQAAVSADSTQVVDNLHAASTAGVIASALPITPEQAARRLAALGSAAGAAPICNPGTGAALVTPWLAYANPTPTDDPVADIAPFWNSVLAPLGTMTLTNPGLAGGHLQLVLSAIVSEDATQLLKDMQSSAGVAALGTTVLSVKDLDPTAFGGGVGITLAAWTTFFAAFPQDVPAFATVGTSTTSPQLALNEQVASFVRRLAQFFDLPPVAPLVLTPVAMPLPLLDEPEPGRDVLAAFVTQYALQPGHAGFAFGQTLTLDSAAALAAAALVFPSDVRAAAWLVEAASAVNALYAVANIGVPDPLRFSIAEALYARGFDSAASITALTSDDC